MENIITLSTWKELEQIYNKNSKVVLEFTSPSAPPVPGSVTLRDRTRLWNAVDILAVQYPDVKFVKVNVHIFKAKVEALLQPKWQASKPPAEASNMIPLPTFLFYKDGIQKSEPISVKYTTVPQQAPSNNSNSGTEYPDVPETVEETLERIRDRLRSMN